MKRNTSIKTYLLAIVTGWAIAWSACTEEEKLDPTPNNHPNDTTSTNNDHDPNTVIDANEVSADLILQGFTAMNGSIPESSNSAELKLDKDTIYLVEGLKNRIRILYPPNFRTGSASVYIQVEGADQYFDVALEEEESTDTVGVFYMEFDPGDWELPFSFNIKIAPHDDSGIPIDEFEREVEVEKKGEDPCSPWTAGGNWIWLWTTINGDFYSAPGRPIGTEASVNGCCLDGYSVDCIANGLPERTWISMDYAAYSMTNLEYISFKEEGTMLGQLIEQTQNIDPSESDFCTGEPAYIRRTKTNSFWGEYTYNPSNRKVTFTTIESDKHEIYLDALDIFVYEYDKYYISPIFDYEIVSCHFLLETSNIEGQERQRLFERRSEISINDHEYAFWYD